MITIRPYNLPSQYYFDYLSTQSKIELSKSRALYDFNIGVLRIIGNYSGGSSDLTYESFAFCNVLKSYLGKYNQCYLSQDLSYYDPYSSTSNFVYINEKNLQDGKLLGINTTDPAYFGLLIIPDIIATEKDALIDIIGEQGKTNINKQIWIISFVGLKNIKEFVENGGIVYSSGKGVYILEAAGVLDQGTVKKGKWYHSIVNV